MTEWMSKAEADRMVDEAMGALDRERAKLAELGRVWQEQTTVRAKDQSLTMTFDGRGELLDLAFLGTKFRTMAPAQLAHTIVETLKRGKAESMARVTEVMGEDATGGLDIEGIASGRVDPMDVINDLLGPMMGDILPSANKSGERRTDG